MNPAFFSPLGHGRTEGRIKVCLCSVCTLGLCFCVEEKDHTSFPGLKMDLNHPERFRWVQGPCSDHEWASKCDPAFHSRIPPLWSVSSWAKTCSPGPWQVPRVAPLGVDLGSCPSSHLRRWASIAPIVREIGVMPLCLEARDLVTILAKREECSSVFSPGRGWEREGKLSVSFIEPQSAMVLNIQFIPFHTIKPFFLQW